MQMIEEIRASTQIGYFVMTRTANAQEIVLYSNRAKSNFHLEKKKKKSQSRST